MDHLVYMSWIILFLNKLFITKIGLDHFLDKWILNEGSNHQYF